MNVVINLNKPADISSQQAVTRVKRLLGVRRAGHTGTLDPLATGVLIICLNEATKIARFLPDLEKEYIFRLKLGEKTDTYDSTGRIIEKKNPAAVHEDDVQRVLSEFLGYIRQTPPMFSAVKKGGVPLYKLARKGMTVERAERTVRIHQLELLSFQSPYVDVRATCSKGTYIRTLCDDIGDRLGTGAHMTSLTRVRVGNFKIQDAATPEELQRGAESFFSIDEALWYFRELTLDHDSCKKLRNGIPISISSAAPFLSREGSDGAMGSMSSGTPEYVRMKNPKHELFGIGVMVGDTLRTDRLFQFP